jgi:PPP family 3-phenylpropionic acid transporter
MTQTDLNLSDLRRIRIYFFLLLGGLGMLMPFISLFYRSRDLSGTQIGLLGTVSSLVGLAAAPIWGHWSDSAQKPRRLLQASLVGTAVCMLLLSRQTIFLGMAIIVGLDSLVASGSETLSNIQVLTITKGNNTSGFGSVRLWGSLGWALFAPLGGWLIERTNLVTPFYGYAISMIVCVLLLGTITTGSSHENTSSPGPRLTLLSGWHILLSDRAMIALTCALIISWLTGSHFHRFEAIYLKQLGASETLIGFVNTIGALIELPAMLWADRLMKRFGTARILAVSFLLQAASMVFVLVHPSVGTIFTQRLVYGVSYSLFTVSSVIFIIEHAPAGQQATALAIVTVTLSSLTQIIAAPLGGVIFDFSGAYWLYALGLIGNLIGWLVLRWGTINPVNHLGTVS